MERFIKAFTKSFKPTLIILAVAAILVFIILGASEVVVNVYSGTPVNAWTLQEAIFYSAIVLAISNIIRGK